MADFVSRPIDISRIRRGVRRLDIELHDVDQAVDSYEGRVFVDRPDADRDTGLSADEGYLGSFFVFGKVYCWGEDEGHCAPASDRRFDRRHPPGRFAKFRVTVAEDALARLQTLDADADEDGVTLSIVAAQSGVGPRREQSSPLQFGRMSLIAYG